MNPEQNMKCYNKKQTFYHFEIKWKTGINDIPIMNKSYKK